MINIGIGIGWAKALYSVANNVIANFKARVLSYPNSIFEAGPCLDATLEELNAIGLLDNASLVITPNAYTEGILYDVVPNTTLGDMDVVRATTATRVNSAGLIEEVPRNLLTYSEQFENTSWLTGGSGAFTITTNSTNAPNGTLTADKLIAPLTNQVIRQNKASINTSCTFSVYLKTNSGTKQMRLFINDTGIESIVNVTSDWQRFTLSGTTGGTLLGSGRVGISNVDILNESSFVYIWGAQFENFATATEYLPTTTRLNIPRIDYTNGSCPSLLVEPQRTNLFTYSNTFSNATWSKNSCTISANSIVSPGGIQNASKLVEGTANDSHHIYQNVISSGQNTFTFYAKQGERKFVYAYAESAGQGKCFDLENGTLGVNIIAAPLNSSITSVGNGWYRCSITISITATALRIGACSANGTFSYLGNGTSGIYLYGAQIEAGSYATSYVPTVATTVTRNADVISKTGISSLIGQTEGTIFFDGIVNNIQNGTSNILNTNKNPSTISSIALTKIKATNKIRFEQFLGNGTFVNIPLLSTNSFLNGIRTKVAIRYKSGDFAMYINGNLEATSTSTYTNIGVKSELFLNDSVAIFAFQESVSFNSAQLYKTPLTNLELKSLSTI